MATRSLPTNHSKINKVSQGIFKFTSRALEQSYRRALVDARATITRLYETFMEAGELTRAQQTQFMRVSGIEREIVRIMSPYLEANKELLQQSSMVTYNQSFYQHAWAIDQASGVSLQWGQVSDNAVRAAAGIGGDVADLTGVLPEKEVIRHKKVMDNAFKNYDSDTRKWIQRDIRQGIIAGDSVPDITKRLRNNSFVQSYGSAERIARTEIARSNGLGAQIAYDEARDQGVNIREVWDATLDDRTRPDHAVADGVVKDNETGLFSVPWGEVRGPRLDSPAEQSINCRCNSVPSVEGFTPELRRVRGEGLQPYQTFKTWATDNSITANRFGQRFDFT